MSAAAEITRWSLPELSQRLRAREISPVEATEACLEQIARLNPELNAFITVTPELAMRQARQAEAEITAGHWRGPLHGVPLSLKDLIDTAGVPTTAGSALFAGRVPSIDADVARKLSAVGAILLGKTNLHEFAYGGSSLVSHFGIVRNPVNARHIAGGSSGGSAAAVACGMGFGSIGTDSAGSIRLPAALCGITGLKPTFAAVSARGVIPLSWSLDHVGPLARTVTGCALLLDAIAGADSPAPATSSARGNTPGSYAAACEAERPLRLGVARAYFFEDLHADVSQAVETAIALLEGVFGASREVTLAVDEDRTVGKAETFAYHEEFLERSSALYQPETLRRIRSGADIPAGEYIRRRAALEEQRRAAAIYFRDVDVLLTPTAPEPAPAIAEMQGENMRPREVRLLRNTRPFNVLGLPAISVPCGQSAAGLPIGLQIAAAPGGEAAVLRAARVLEQLLGR